MTCIFTDQSNPSKAGKCLRVLFATVCLLLSAIGASAQQQTTVTGKVTDDAGDAVSGVSVIVQGTATGAVTSAAGVYSIVVPANSILEFNHMGYQKAEIAVGNRSVVDVTLEASVEVMNELVVVGYGALQRRSITNAVTQIKPEDFVAGVSNPLVALQGKVPGLTVGRTNGSDPNSDARIQIRGINSVAGPQEVLIVVDGIPGTDINTVAKEDIENITVLKDASSGAIYGTRGTGGVVIVTTKQPQKGRFRANYSAELSIDNIMRSPDLLSADDFRTYGRTRNGQFDYGGSTDWMDAITNRNPFTHRHVASVSGGTGDVGITVSLNARDAVSTIIGSDRKEVGGRINGYVKFLDDRMKLTTNVSYTEMNMNFTDMAIWGIALRMNPTYPLYATPENPGDDGATTGHYMLLNRQLEYNPAAEIDRRTNKMHKTFLNSSANLSFQILPSWSVQATAGYNRVAQNTSGYYSKNHRLSLEAAANGTETSVGQASHGYATSYNKVLDISTNFVKDFGDHYLNVVGGYSYQEFNGNSFGASDGGFLMDGLAEWNLGSGYALTEGKAGMSSGKDDRTRLVGFFARANYDWKDRYIATLSARYEGTSKFSQQPWGFFPSASTGWRISNEQFMSGSRDWVDNLLLRVSYGQTGNQDVPSDHAYKTYSSGNFTYINGQWVRIYREGYARNENLKWEIKKEWNVGADFALFGHRLTGSLDWYRRTVQDLIFPGYAVSMPPNLYGTMYANVGDMKNSGFEVELTGKVVEGRNWSYSTTITADLRSKTYLYSSDIEVNQTGSALPQPYSPGSVQKYVTGEELGRFYMFKHAGFNENGRAMIYGADGEVKPYGSRSDPADRQYIGNALPKAVISWSNQVRFRNFDLSLYFRSWIGHDIYNVQQMYLAVNNATTIGYNVFREAYTAGGNAHLNSTDGHFITDYWLEKGTFLKLDNITLGYNLPKFVKWIDNVRVSFTARNVFVLTSYSGSDPEIDVTGLFPGLAGLNAYPMTRTFLFGVSIGF